MSFVRKWRVFCARCGHHANVRGDDRELAKAIDNRCPQCWHWGLDAIVRGGGNP